MRRLGTTRTLATCMLIGMFAVPARATVTASCWSYEVADGRSHPTTASAGISRTGTPGTSAANAAANGASLQSVATMTGCGVSAPFQQPCNTANTQTTFNDVFTLTANAPTGTAVQVRSTLRFSGSVNGTGTYGYDFGAHLNGVGPGGGGSTGGTVQTVSNLDLDQTLEWIQTLSVGSNYSIDGSITSNVGNRICALGTNTCDASISEWTITLLTGLTLQIEVLTPGLTAQMIGAGGHNYQSQPVSVDESAPSRTSLTQAGPNPARGAVALSLTLDKETAMDVGVFDLSGRRVATIARVTLGVGTHALHWDGRSTNGRPVHGMLFVRARGEGVDLKRQVVLLR